MNLCIFKGRIGKDAPILTQRAGLSYTDFKLAVPDQLKPKDKAKTVWLKVSAWRKLAEVIVNYCKPGQEILIKGRVAVSTYEKNTIKITVYEIIADTMEFCGPAPAPKEEDDDIPF